MTRALMALLIVIVSACGPSADIPSEAEAHAFVQRLVSAAQAGDVDRLCELANCIRDDFVNRPIAPPTAPTVVGSWVLEPGTTTEGQQTSGGRVLVLCGSDAESHPYRTELLVIRANGKLHTASFKYWLGITVGTSGTPATGSGPPPSPPSCG